MEKTCSIRHWRPVLEALAGHGHTWWIYIVWYDQADQTDPLYVIVDSWLPLAGSHDSPAESVAVGLRKDDGKSVHDDDDEGDIDDCWQERTPRLDPNFFSPAAC